MEPCGGPGELEGGVLALLAVLQPPAPAAPPLPAPCPSTGLFIVIYQCSDGCCHRVTRHRIKSSKRHSRLDRQGPGKVCLSQM